MATQTAPSGVCATCGQHATTRCAGCADTEHTGTQGATFYCSKPCQTKGWLKHKKACQAAQGRKKLFRAAEMIQEIFFALRAELFDLNITKVERAEDGKSTSTTSRSRAALSTTMLRSAWTQMPTPSVPFSPTSLVVTYFPMASTT